MTILKELWTGENEFADVNISYQYVLELRERSEKTMKLAQEKLRKNQVRYKKNYNKKTKNRLFSKCDKVLVMLPTTNNKLLMQWKGPYQIIQKMGAHDYKILLGKKEKNYYVNMLKKCYARKKEQKTKKKENLKITASKDVTLVEETSSIYEKPQLELGTYRQKENVSDVKLRTELNDSQSRQLQALLESYDKVFPYVPGKTSMVKHEINLVDKKPVCSKSYLLPYTLR